jgi:hypothetical protein
MVVAHYGYLVLKMPSPDDVLKIWGDCDAGVCALEKLLALAATQEAATKPRGQDLALPSSRQRGSTSTPRVQPSVKENIQIRAEAAQTTRIMGDLDNK